MDASLIVRGRVAPADLTTDQRSYFVQARVRLASGTEIEVVSTRFVPAVFRLDLWSPECWREQARNRRQRRAQVRAVAQRIASLPPDLPVVLGGDFNAPQGDAAFRSSRPVCTTRSVRGVAVGATRSPTSSPSCGSTRSG